MSAQTTPNGFTYPTGSDAVGALDTIVQTLAEQIDDHVALQKSGTVTSGTLVANTWSSNIAVTFTTPFPASGPVPQVTASVRGTSTTDISVQVNTITRSGCIINVLRVTGTGALTADWIATNVGNW